MTTTQTRAMAPTQQAVSTRQEFGATEMTSAVDAMSKALAAQATAAIQARYIMAQKYPRRWLSVRKQLVDICRDPTFAMAAWYSKPVGGQKIEGFSIRFAEEAARAMTNLDVQTFAIYDDENLRITRVSVVDLESNINESREVSIRKVVERRSSKGREVVGERTNSYGQTVYIVKATDDEISNVENSAISKAKRNAVLSMLRADIKAECQRRLLMTLDDEGRADPYQWLKDMTDKFAEVGVGVDDLEAWLGHKIEKTTRGEVSRLRTIYGGLVNGDIDFAAEIEREKTEREARLARAREAAANKDSEPPPPSAERPPMDETPRLSKADVLKYAQSLKVSKKEREELCAHTFDGRGIDDLSTNELDQFRLELESYAADRGE